MIALVAIVLDEIDVINRWIDGIRRLPGVFSEFVIVDGGSKDGTFERLCSRGFFPLSIPWRDDYARQRNNALCHCKSEWAFELDADEIPSVPLLGGLADIVKNADDAKVNCIGVPRLNFIDGRLTAAAGADGLDFQYRLHRADLRWTGRVHEELHSSARVELSINEGHFIRHVKTSERNAQRNSYYEALK